MFSFVRFFSKSQGQQDKSAREVSYSSSVQSSQPVEFNPLLLNLLQQSTNGVVFFKIISYMRESTALLSDAVYSQLRYCLDGQGRCFARNRVQLTTFDFSGIDLLESLNNTSKIAPYEYIFDLIARNMDIEVLNLSNAGLSDQHIGELIDVLELNTHIKNIFIQGNCVSRPLFNELHDQLSARNGRHYQHNPSMMFVQPNGEKEGSADEEFVRQEPFFS